MAEPQSDYLIDSDIFIDAARGYAPAIDFLSQRRSLGPIRMSAITAMELVAGCRNKTELSVVKSAVESMIILELSAETSAIAYSQMTAYFLSDSLQIPDSLEAATAIHHNLTLCTRNAKHYKMISALSLHRPY